MNSNLTDQQQLRIRDLLLTQIQIYEQAIPVAEILASNYDVSPERQNEMAGLDALMNDCSCAHTEMTSLLGDTNPTDLSSDIRDAAAGLANRMERLIPLINALEERALQVKQRMYPELKEPIRAKKMHNAYGSSTPQSRQATQS